RRHSRRHHPHRAQRVSPRFRAIPDDHLFAAPRHHDDRPPAGAAAFPRLPQPEKIRMSASLELKDVTIRFGGLKAVSELDFDVHSGELVGLIGPNGAGKTTIFNLITGVYTPTSGTIAFNGVSIPRQ